MLAVSVSLRSQIDLIDTSYEYELKLNMIWKSDINIEYAISIFHANRILYVNIFNIPIDIEISNP